MTVVMMEIVGCVQLAPARANGDVVAYADIGRQVAVGVVVVVLVKTHPLPLPVKEGSKYHQKQQGNTSPPSQGGAGGESKRKLSFKEKREMEQLERDIAALEAEQKELEEALCSGTLNIDELTEKSKRLPKLKDELDEKSMRWLELSEIEN